MKTLNIDEVRKFPFFIKRGNTPEYQELYKQAYELKIGEAIMIEESDEKIYAKAYAFTTSLNEHFKSMGMNNKFSCKKIGRGYRTGPNGYVILRKN